MTTKYVSGAYAAVLTPRKADDTIDVAALVKLVHFLISKGISKFALNGATGEYCLTRPDHLRTILSTVQEASDGKAQILCGVGAPGTALAIELASIAQQHDIQGLLLPMPYFFRYQQEDLELFCREVAKSTTLPVLLYNLPQFTSGLEKETVRKLIVDVPNIIGIKDSSGSLDIIRYLTEHDIDACRIIGNDSALAVAIAEKLCDGVVSGVACAMPEIILNLYAECQHPESPHFKEASTLLGAFIEQLNFFPVPWGLKWTLELRGIISATFSQPVAPHRITQRKQLESWLLKQLPRALAAE